MRIPRATYRIQFHKGFRFQDLQDKLDYLLALGVDTVYASPIFKARPGSGHGYDVTDPLALNPELGTEEDFETLAAAVKDRNMGWLQDIVPNHMAYSPENSMLMDVLESGPESAYRGFFEIDWEHEAPTLNGRLLAPFLGTLYGEALEQGVFRLLYTDSGFALRFYDKRYPVALESYDEILRPLLAKLRMDQESLGWSYTKLLGLLYVLQNLPSIESGNERTYQVRFAKTLLTELYRDDPCFARLLEEELEAINGQPGEPESFDRLDAILDMQHYRFALWKAAGEEINYRRFFNINELIALSVHKHHVFESTHRFTINLVRRGLVHGLRIDHVDGLRDPRAYLERLARAVPDAYLLVEKILDYGEPLPPTWPVQGTTGYDFLNILGGVFINRPSQPAFDRLSARYDPERPDPEQLKARFKRLIMEDTLAGDLDNLARRMKLFSARLRHASDITLRGLSRALEEVLAHFPVYRTYLDAQGITGMDRQYIEEAIELARPEAPRHGPELDFIENLLLRRDIQLPVDDGAMQALWEEIAARFQQLTSPLMAKGFEDTQLYADPFFVGLNEVGGWPARFGLDLDEFHAYLEAHAQQWPNTMNATATHDTKRGEDTRARLYVLTELAEEYDALLSRWSQAAAGLKRRDGGREMPSGADEYFVYQTILGSYPRHADQARDYEQRLQDYLRKAVREGKVSSSWRDPDEAYEEALLGFAKAMVTTAESGPEADFPALFEPFAAKVAWHGVFNSMAQVLLKFAAPGVPDLYQGCERFDFSFVDPDNRRPVDFAHNASLLDGLRQRFEAGPAALWAGLWQTPHDGRLKLLLTHLCLNARKQYPALFRLGDYLPLQASGPRAGNIVAFVRREGEQAVLAVACRFSSQVYAQDRAPTADAWEGTTIAVPDGLPTAWTNMLTAQHLDLEGGVPVGRLLDGLPVALLLGSAQN